MTATRNQWGTSSRGHLLNAFGAAFPSTSPTASTDMSIDRPCYMLVMRETLVDQCTQLRAIVSEIGDPLSDGSVEKVLPDLGSAILEHDPGDLGACLGLGGSSRELRDPELGSVTAAALIAWMGELGAIDPSSRPGASEEALASRVARFPAQNSELCTGGRNGHSRI